jgi:hypothetical protein
LFFASGHQEMLGHANIHTTARYTQVSPRLVAVTKSPLDQLGCKPKK